jgi:peptidoglycan hydrolase-like protein with peptidoglycan-binding domain
MSNYYYMNIQKFAALVLVSGIGVSGAFFSPAHAQVQQPAQTPAPGCVILSSNLHRGSVDFSSNGDVTKLQTFLSTKGYFSYPPVGIFGPLTRAAVQQFQRSNGISATGYVGPITKGVIQSTSCGTPTPIPPVMSMGIDSISPASGAVGTTVNVTGYGFTSDNTILFSGGAIRNIPVTSGAGVMCMLNATNCRSGLRQTLTFTIPSSIGPNCPPGSMCPMWMRLVTPGDYTVAVNNANGTSNTVTFTVTSTTPVSGQSLSISGVDAPAQLSVGQSGTWAVRVSNTGNSTSLHYNVVWGDEAPMPYMMSSVSSQSIQSSATVTHTYTRAGTYTPVFTVTNDAGQSATVSSTVVVN